MDPVAIGVAIVLTLGFGVAGFLLGKRSVATSRAEAVDRSLRLEEYDFYPFAVNPVGHVEFSADAFDEAVVLFLKERNPRALASS